MIAVKNPLRETITAQGPLSLDTMFEVGNAVIHSPASATENSAEDIPEPESARETFGGKRRLARFKAKRMPAAYSASASVRKDAEASEAKPDGTLTKSAGGKILIKRAARVAANPKANGKIRSSRGMADACRQTADQGCWQQRRIKEVARPPRQEISGGPSVSEAGGDHGGGAATGTQVRQPGLRLALLRRRLDVVLAHDLAPAGNLGTQQCLRGLRGALILRAKVQRRCRPRL